MTKDELVNSLQKRDPLLANAVSNMVDYISDPFLLLTQARNRRNPSMLTCIQYLQTVTEPCRKETVSIEELHHRKLPSMPYKCLTVPNLTDCNVYLTISHTTRSIICQREASA